MVDIIERVGWLLVLIGVMIIVHELGHYWAARFFDVKVEAFSFGFGPRLFGFRKGETDFRFSLVLLGGYVKMAGEQLGEDGAHDPRSLLAKPRWQRMIIAFAGPAMNIVLSVALLTGLFMVHYEKIPIHNSPTVGYVLPDSAAAKAGVRDGDRVVSVDGIDNPTWHDFIIREINDTNTTMSLSLEREGKRIEMKFMVPASAQTHLGTLGMFEQHDVLVGQLGEHGAARDAGLKVGDKLKSLNGVPVRMRQTVTRVVGESNGKPVEVVYTRGGDELTSSITPRWQDDSNAGPQDPKQRWMIGVVMSDATEIVKLSFPEALRESVIRNAENAGLIYHYLEGMVERRFSPKSMDGPLGIAREAQKAAKLGPMVFIDLMTIVSLNLAIFNLLPIPILDGGVILMLLIEMIRRQDLSLQFKEAVFKVGFAFLMMVVVFVIYNDISKSRSESAQVPTPGVQQQQPRPKSIPPPPAPVGETAKP